MTIRDVYENCLIELNKVQAPSLLVDDFIYLYNKAVQQVFNKRYNFFEVNQQLTDDLRVLTKSEKLFPTQAKASSPVFGQSYDCILPDDYVHILNCICEFEDMKPGNVCDAGDSIFQQGANKLDTNQWSSVINNYYMRPSVKLPYYYIINIDNPSGSTNAAPDQQKKAVVGGNGIRYGNATLPIMLIKCGNDQRYRLRCVYIDYLRAPHFLSINQNILDAHNDNSLILEFPDYMIYEIINEIVTLVMENAKDPRTQTFIPLNTSVPQK